MANTGYSLKGAVACLTAAGPADIDDTAIADTAELLSLEVTLAAEVCRTYAVKAVEDNTGACAGDLYISVLLGDMDPDSETYQTGPSDGGTVNDPCWTLALDVDQNETRIVTFAVYGDQAPRHKIHLRNSTGQTLAVTVNYQDVDIPAAS